MHACPDESDTTIGSVRISTEPSAFLQELRDTAGVGIGPIEPTTLGNLPALAAEIDPTRNRCSPILLHENGLGIGALGQGAEAGQPGHDSSSAQSRGMTIGVLISASSEDEYAAWLPIAQAYVDTFAFDITGG